MSWAIMPLVNGWREFGEQAAYDCLSQSLPTNLLLVCQGVDDPTRQAVEDFQRRQPDRVFAWFWDPMMPSLSGVWNRALDAVWAMGDTEALVVNHDIRIRPKTFEVLLGVMGHTDALLVSAVGVTAEQYQHDAPIDDRLLTPPGANYVAKPLAPGGPDFSCFVISQACHQAYRFDEGFIPAFAEDLDLHRRLLLDGKGSQIFSVNVPYLHYASQTLKAMTPERRALVDRQIESISRAHYARKWGTGGVNRETFIEPFGPEAHDNVTTPELQAALRD
jgi:hypothetical protein